MKLVEFKTWPTNYRLLDVKVRGSSPLGSLTSRHQEQGFQWGSEAIMFMTLDDGWCEGWMHIEVFLLTEFDLGDDAERALKLPFDVLKDETVVVAGMFDEDPQTIRVPIGSYALYYETGLLRPFDQLQKENEELDLDDEEACNDPTIWCRLTFVPEQDAQPVVLRAGEGISPSLPLLLDRPSEP